MTDIPKGSYTTNIVISPHIPYNIESLPFGLSFEWKDKRITINLKNGEDALKLAGVYKKILDDAGIEYEEINI